MSRRLEQRDLGAGGALHRVGGAQALGLRLGGGEGQVAVLAEGEAEAADDLQPEAGDPHVQRVGELPADAAGGERGGGAGVGRIALHHGDAAAVAELGQPAGDGAADDGAAADHHVIRHRDGRWRRSRRRRPGWPTAAGSGRSVRAMTAAAKPSALSRGRKPIWPAWAFETARAALSEVP